MSAESALTGLRLAEAREIGVATIGLCGGGRMPSLPILWHLVHTRRGAAP